jgi:lipopolysaccharide/colanic/teichoic acid biosynthesis glycosyltransferase
MNVSGHESGLHNGLSAFDELIKRGFDIVVAVIGLFLTWWLLLLVYVAASIDTRKEGVFLQDRIGQHGALFKVIKIRTMRDIPTIDTTVTSQNDPRVTSLGRLLRKTKIDELPQLINVLNGTMSLVGPRPTVVEDYEKMDEQQKQRVSVNPGITGLAQINGNTSLTWPERIDFDLQYIADWSIWLDVRILLETVLLIISGEADTHPVGKDEWS